MKYDAYVIDFETLSTKASAVVVSFALIPFNTNEKPKDLSFGELLSRVVYFKFDLSKQKGRSVQTKVLDWWETLPDNVKKSQLDPSDNDIELSEFVSFISDYFRENGWRQNKNVHGFCRGMDFDFPILYDIFWDNELDPTDYLNQYWCNRDIRSIISGAVCDCSEGKLEYPIDGFEAHNPRHDAAKGVLDVLYTLQE